MIETLYIITFMIIIIIGIIKIANDTIKPVNKSQETKYIDYAKFYGAETLKDQDFIKKMKMHSYFQLSKTKRYIQQNQCNRYDQITHYQTD